MVGLGLTAAYNRQIGYCMCINNSNILRPYLINMLRSVEIDMK